jgi:lipoprotein NlpI
MKKLKANIVALAAWLAICLSALTAAVVATTLPASAITVDNLPILDPNTCTHGTGDAAIAACTRDINLGHWHGAGLAWAYVNRAKAYLDKGDYDRAIADATEAIRLDPKFALAYASRAGGYLDKGDYDRAIADATEAIRLDAKTAFAYVNRAGAYVDKGDYDRAIVDATEAIRLDPEIALAYANRAGGYFHKGDHDRAIADATEAIRLDQKTKIAYFYRAVANVYAGSLLKAMADLNEASALNPKHAYTALWLDIVGQRSNLPSRLSQLISTIDMTKWPAPVIRLYLGQMTPEAVLAAAADHADAATKKGQVCEANFYSGQLALQKGAKEDATRLFRLAAADCPKGFIEWSAAKAELKALGVTR